MRSTTALTIVGGLLSAASLVAGVDLPEPHPAIMDWKVIHARSSLVDESRKDPYNAYANRKVAYSIFGPVWGKKFQDKCTSYKEDRYMPDLTAKASNLQFYGEENANIFEQVRFQSCNSTANETTASDFPVIILEPAVNTSRFMYNQLARQVSACGAWVITVDHPHDASIVEFDDGAVIRNEDTVSLNSFEVNRPWDEVMEKAVDTRIADIDVVLNEIKSLKVLTNLFPGIKFKNEESLKIDKLFVIGHGLGGTVAVKMAISDARVRWATNLSGTIQPIQNTTYDWIVFFNRDGYTRETDSAWNKSITYISSNFAEWRYKQADQFDYSDLPLINQIVNSTRKPKGIGNPAALNHKGPEWSFYCMTCFVEGYFRDTGLPIWGEKNAGSDDRTALNRCINICQPPMVPHGWH